MLTLNFLQEFFQRYGGVEVGKIKHEKEVSEGMNNILRNDVIKSEDQS